MPNDTLTPQTGALISNDLKKMLIVPLITIIGAVVVAWYAAQQSQSEIRFQTQANKEAIAVNSAAIKANAEALNQIVISMARFSEAQTRIAADLRDLQIEQRNNNAQMNKHR